jgi:hypothetical protein
MGRTESRDPRDESEAERLDRNLAEWHDGLPTVA